MIDLYVELLKEQIMQSTLGNTTKTLTEMTEILLDQHTEHHQEIAEAYQFVHRELTGDFS